ncbi:co-chaperone protein HscB, mitochondrial precursor [Lophiostoma macrostomum CBS 122681]|uniref:Co-chaperone protein HscB, mitochondrial n=1 Tax=Lophiostoma macrostomum CBS 122681 TaxID=1314788 RepID=A0A6A6SLK0_9PLEO|nr:co-chaperone protein HscB, mitochondrial precursor [Lophiostoma macrostomum CBS 122681]
MRRTTPAAFSRLSATILEPSSAPLRQRRLPTTCMFCAHQAIRQPPARRHQSTSTKENTNAPPQTHYTFFPRSLPAGPPPHGSFGIDLSALKREFLQLQGRAHPDLHPPEDKNKAQAMSARINEAYKTLQSPLLRAQYLLSLRGIEIAEDETAKVEDPELLMEVLEAREQIEEAESEEDLVQMKTENDAKIEESVKILEGAFAKEDIDGAKSEAVKLRYWINIKESLDAWERGKPVVLAH